ncbi:Enolase [Aminobacter sp. MSH1]|uniref:phosphopyruvate hydratase n=1 Tax=Aminobacter sp. MSH1 TaxID=374606 RepID=UPI000D3AC059|nr:phosphopyruvate hydratase [Aminobacter sp. MSH1]AWC25224.1 Enolase [Aminobacter sp. MSH1]
MPNEIAHVDALEILDSRGNPTVEVEVALRNGSVGVARVPSGASTGKNEAVELRDGDPTRFGGLGVRKAVENVRTILSERVLGEDATKQAAIDALLIEADGTPGKSKLGANAILGVSMAVARAAANSVGLPLYAYLGGATARRLPIPMMNVINGGKHAGNRLAFQEFMIVPHGAPSFSEALRYGVETFRALKRELERRGLPTAVGDEGGFAPDLESDEEACELIVEAIERAGFTPGKDVAIALDPAASSFFSDGAYDLASGERLDREALLDLYARWVKTYPIVSIEDGFDEADWDGYVAQTAAIGDRIQIVGDDNYVTNPKFIAEGIRRKATNAVLIKLNQIGTVTETVAAIELARTAGWRSVVSHRSGETEDSFIADFAVAFGTGQIKTGSLSRSERIAKYNRLLWIERQLGTQALFSSPFIAGDQAD